MDISHYNQICAVRHDLSTTRSQRFTKVPYDEVTLLNTNGNRTVPNDLYGAFTDERGNLFLGLSEVFKTYNLVLKHGGVDHYVNYANHEEVGRFLEWEPEAVNGFFKLMDSRKEPRFNQERCDAARNGPFVFIREGQVPVGGVVNSLRPMSLGDLESHFSLLSVDGVAHLVYVKYLEGRNDSNEEFETNESDLPTAARSIFPLLKLVLEWASMAEHPWNSREDVAVACREFVERLGMPELVKDDINANHGPMHVHRYLRGDTDARRQPPTAELSPLTDLTKRWLRTKMLYGNTTVFYRELAR